MRELRLTVPKDQRIHPLAIAIWRAGVRPESWAMQCGPDFDIDMDGEYLDRALYEAGMRAARQLEHDHALAREIERAREILASQGKVLAGFDPAGPEGDETVIAEQGKMPEGYWETSREIYAAEEKGHAE